MPQIALQYLWFRFCFLKARIFIHRVLHNAKSGHGDDDVASFTMFNFLLQHDPLLAQAINDIDNLLHPFRTRIERTKLD